MSSMMPIDGALLTPVHAFSFHNIPGDSFDQEMMELIYKEELEDEEAGIGNNAASTTLIYAE